MIRTVIARSETTKQSTINTLRLLLPTEAGDRNDKLKIISEKKC